MEVAEGAEAVGVEASLQRQDPPLVNIKARNTPLLTGNQETHTLRCGE